MVKNDDYGAFNRKRLQDNVEEPFRPLNRKQRTSGTILGAWLKWVRDLFKVKFNCDCKGCLYWNVYNKHKRKEDHK